MDYHIVNEKRLAAAFLLYSIKYVRVEFDGSGDSGQIDSAYIERENGEQVTSGYPILFMMPGRNEFNPESGWTQGEPYEMELPLVEAVEHFVEEALDRSNVDWYNNDGGYGHWEWTPNNGLEFAVEVRITQTETAHYEERHLGEGVEE